MVRRGRVTNRLNRPCVLVTGASGLLGAHIAAGFSAAYDVVGVDRHPLWGDLPVKAIHADLSQAGVAEDVVRTVSPETIVHCAAMVNVDACEGDPVEAEQVNGLLPRRLARAAPAGSRFVQISTDGIFRGDSPFAAETRLPCPRTAYGRSKLRGEWEAQLATPRHLVVRTNFFGWGSGRKVSSAEWMYNALASQEHLMAFDDVFFTPIYVVDLVERMAGLMAKDATGIVHVAGRDRVSKHDFILRVAEAAGLSAAHVRRGSIAAVGLAADRPKEMSLDSGRAARLLGVPPPDCAAGIHRFLADRGRPLGARFAPHSPVSTL
jgi:dTDP-4-dehydrorhamnose reductase